MDMDETRKGARCMDGEVGGWMYLLVVTALEKAGVWRVGDIQRHLDVLFPGWPKTGNTLGLLVGMDWT